MRSVPFSIYGNIYGYICPMKIKLCNQKSDDYYMNVSILLKGFSYSNYIDGIKRRLYPIDSSICSNNIKLDYKCKGLERYLKMKNMEITNYIFNTILYINNNYEDIESVFSENKLIDFNWALVYDIGFDNKMDYLVSRIEETCLKIFDFKTFTL